MILNFYSQAHMGDVVIAKPFCKELINILKPEEVRFSHGYNSKLTDDLCQKGNPFDDVNITHESHKVFCYYKGNILFINMWAGVTQSQIPNLRHASLNDNSYCIFDYMLDRYNYFLNKELKIDISYMNESPEKYFWVVDKDKFPLYRQVPIAQGYRKIVLLYNQEAQSGQIKNENMRNHIYPLVEKYKDVMFYLTSPKDLDGAELQRFDNVTFVTDFYEKTPMDIWENALFSEVCDIIVGAVSAPYMSTWTAPNLMNPSKQFVPITSMAYGDSMWHKSQKALNHRVRTIPEAFTELNDLL